MGSAERFQENHFIAEVETQSAAVFRFADPEQAELTQSFEQRTDGERAGGFPLLDMRVELLLDKMIDSAL